VRSPAETGAERLKSVENADVYKDERPAGTLRRDGSDVVFRYHQSYLADPSAPPLAWSIPKYESDVRAAGGSVPAFFAGLLPEGLRLRGAVAATKTSEDDHLTILVAVGADTIGDVRVVPARSALTRPVAAFDEDAISPPDLRDLFDQASGSEVLRTDPAALPGVQAKVSAQLASTPISTRSGPAILKLAPEHGFPRLIENEHFFMGLAAKCGLRVPRHRIVRDEQGCAGLLVSRFDRRLSAHGQLNRLAQEDACQVLGQFPAAKYRLKTEDVISALSSACERGGGSARVSTLALLRLVAYAYATGNGDLHGKNFSVYQPEMGLWTASPAYDLLCTQPYLRWRDPMALDLYGRANKLTRPHLVDAGNRLGVPERATIRMLNEVCIGVAHGLDSVEQIGFEERVNQRLRELLMARLTELS